MLRKIHRLFSTRAGASSSALLSQEQISLQSAVRDFCRKHIAPRAAAIDRDNQFPSDLWLKFGDMGLLGISCNSLYFFIIYVCVCLYISISMCVCVCVCVLLGVTAPEEFGGLGYSFSALTSLNINALSFNCLIINAPTPFN